MTALTGLPEVLAEVDNALDDVNGKLGELRGLTLVLLIAISYETAGLDSDQRAAMETVIGRTEHLAAEAAESGVKARAAVLRLKA